MPGQIESRRLWTTAGDPPRGPRAFYAPEIHRIPVKGSSQQVVQEEHRFPAREQRTSNPACIPSWFPRLLLLRLQRRRETFALEVTKAQHWMETNGLGCPVERSGWSAAYRYRELIPHSDSLPGNAALGAFASLSSGRNGETTEPPQ